MNYCVTVIYYTYKNLKKGDVISMTQKITESRIM